LVDVIDRLVGDESSLVLKVPPPVIPAEQFNAVWGS
jgi:hypothetical protein